MRSILAVIYVFLYLLIGLPVLGIEWLIGKWNKKVADISTLRIVQWGFRCVLFISGVKLDVRGHEQIPKDEAVLYVGNHRGFFDIISTYTLCPGLTGYIAKDGINKVPSLRIFMRRVYCLFLNRNDLRQGMKVILQAIEYVKQGVSICIFPEGTRNKDRENPKSVLPFKDGSFKIAQKTGCKVVPMAITGSADILENHFPWIHKGTITITYGKPTALSELTAENAKHPGAYFQNRIEEMLEEQ